MTKRGFTLVEIMIVVAIIALLAAIAIPNLLRARLNANEAATVEALKTASGAASSYASVNQAGYPPSFALMTAAGGTTPPYLDNTFVDPTIRNGYLMAYTAQGAADTNGNFPNGFYIFATPNTIGVTGGRDFYVDQAGVVCYIDPAAGADPGFLAGDCTAVAGWSALQ